MKRQIGEGTAKDRCNAEVGNDQGIRARIDHTGKLIPGTDFCCSDPEKLDLLDELSYRLKELGINDYDFKQYDYPSIKGE